MAYDVDPSLEVTGGPWYSETQELDQEFIDVLYAAILKYLSQRSFSTVQDVATFVQQSGMSRETLRPDDIETLLNTLIYDAKVEAVVPASTGSGVKYYRIRKLEPSGNTISSVPCCVCPVASVKSPLEFGGGVALQLTATSDRFWIVS